MILNKDDVARIVEDTLSKLELDMGPVSGFEPNDRTIRLRFGNKVLSEVTFTVEERPEYEG